MKRILFILALFISQFTAGQYQEQPVSNSGTLYYGRGLIGADSGYVFRRMYADTATANSGYVDLIPGAMIRTTGGLIWLRNDAATAWIYVGGSAGGGGGGGALTIYNGDGTLLGDRVVDMNSSTLSFINNGGFVVSDPSSGNPRLKVTDEFSELASPDITKQFRIYNDSVVLDGLGQSASASDSVVVRTASGQLLTRAQSTLFQRFGFSGEDVTLTANRAVNMGTFKFDYNWTDGDYFSIQNHRLEYYTESGSGATFKSAAMDFTPDDAFINTFDNVWGGGLNYLMGVGSGGTYEGDGTGVLMKVSSPDSNSLILVRHNEIRIKPDRGKILIDTLNVGPGTHNVRWNAATGYLTVADTTSGGSTPTLQEVLTAGSTLTTDNIIDSDGNDFGIINGGVVGIIGTSVSFTAGADPNFAGFEAQSTTSTSLRVVVSSIDRSAVLLNTDSVLLNAGDVSLGRSQFKVKSDSILIKPGLGNLYIDSLDEAAGTHTLRYDPTTGLVTYDEIPSGSGLEVGVTTITEGTDTRVLFDDNGVLGEDAGFVYNKTTDRLTLIGNIDGSANGVLYLDGTGTGNLGTGLSMDATNESGGKIKTIFSTGTTASAGAGALAIYDATSGYQMVIRANSEVTVGPNADTDAGDFTVQVRGNLWANLGATINDSGADSDTRIEGDTDANLVFIDASADFVGISTSSPTSTLHVDGSFAKAYLLTETGITLNSTHSVVEVAATGQTITLPTATTCTGRIYTIKLTASGTGTVATTSSENIDGSTTYSLSAINKYVTVISNGIGWLVIANN